MSRLTFAFLLLFPVLAFASDWTITPMRLELGASARSGVITVKNAGAGALNFQVQAQAWAQGEDGAELLTPTDDLVVFPKILSLAGGESRVVRVGTRTLPAAGAAEKTYRVFVEELPTVPAVAEGDDAKEGMALNVVYRFGAPVFVKPPKPVMRLSMSELKLVAGHLEWTVANQGTQHVPIGKISYRAYDKNGALLVKQDVQERYLLAGVTRRYREFLSPDVCQNATQLNVDLRDKSTTIGFERVVQGDPGACQ